MQYKNNTNLIQKRNIYILGSIIKSMTRYRQVKKFGNSWAIALKTHDITDLNLKEGDFVDIEDAVRKCSIPQDLGENEE